MDLQIDLTPFKKLARKDQRPKKHQMQNYKSLERYKEKTLGLTMMLKYNMKGMLYDGIN